MQIELGRQVERYTIEALLGEGAQGRVFRVRHMQLGTEHALKVVLNAGPTVRDRLLREGRAQAKLRHANIVNVTDVIDVDGQPGLVMEFVRGPSLNELLHAQALTIEQADLLANGILDGMIHAHGHQFIHRDLKPDNIICAVTPRGLVPKVADFGLVKALGADGAGIRQTRSGVMMGTAHYMSPEQIRSTKSVDKRTDVWALGVILYELLSRKVPFDAGEDLFEIFSAITSGRYTPVGDLRPETPDRMRRAIESALVTEVDDRVKDVQTLAALWRGEIQSARESGTKARSAWDESMLSRYTDGESLPPPEPSGEFQTWADGTMDDASEPAPTMDDAVAIGATVDDVPPPRPPNITQMVHADDVPAAKQTKPTLSPSTQAEPTPPRAAQTAQGPAASPGIEPVPLEEKRKGGILPMLALGAVVVLGGGAAVLGAGAMLAGGSSVTEPEPPTEEVVVPLPATVEQEAGLAGGEDVGTLTVAEPTPAPEPVIKPRPAPAREPIATAPKPTPVVAPEPPPVVAPKPAPTPIVPATPSLGTLTVRKLSMAAEDKVQLMTRSGTLISAGRDVPAGEYTILVTTGGKRSTMPKKVDVTAGQGVTLICDAGDCRANVK